MESIANDLLAEAASDKDPEVVSPATFASPAPAPAPAPAQAQALVSAETVAVPEVEDEEATATAAATAALFQAALAFAQNKPAKQSSSASAAPACTPTRKSSSFSFLQPTASSSVKKRSSTASALVSSSSSVPDVALTTPTAAWRPSSSFAGLGSASVSASVSKPRLTVPKSPRFRVDERSRTCARPVPLSTAEREQTLVAEETRKLHEQLKRNKEDFERAKNQAANAKETSQVRSTKQLTIPTTPCFLLSKKNGPKLMSNTTAAPLGAQEEAAHKPKKLTFDEQATAAGGAASGAAAGHFVGPKKPTVFEPFKFATDARASAKSGDASAAAASAAAVVIPAAEQAARFLRDARVYDAPKANVCKKPTIPVSPRLSKRTHHSSSSSSGAPASADEREAMLMEEIRKHHAFKAKPVDRRVFESAGDMGVPKVAVKAATTVQEFTLRTEARSAAAAKAAAEAAASAAAAAVTASAFKARPMPNFAAAPPSDAAPAATPFKPTIAVSPKFSVKHAAAAPARRQLPHHTVVEQEKHLALQSARTVSRPSLTEPAPFALKSVARHSESVAQFNDIVRQVEQRLREVEFHAKPLPKTTFEAPPQTPRASESGRAPLMPLDVQLQSATRASQRAAFDQNVAANVAESAAKKAKAKASIEEQENAAVAKLRRMSVAEGGLLFKAKPVLMDKDQYPTPHTRPAPPTMPKSPFLLTKQRALAAAAAHQ